MQVTSHSSHNGFRTRAALRKWSGAKRLSSARHEVPESDWLDSEPLYRAAGRLIAYLIAMPVAWYLGVAIGMLTA